jgi:hypothetical protein
VFHAEPKTERRMSPIVVQWKRLDLAQRAGKANRANEHRLVVLGGPELLKHVSCTMEGWEHVDMGDDEDLLMRRGGI